MAKRMIEGIEIEIGSGNVFADYEDLGLPEAAEMIGGLPVRHLSSYQTPRPLPC
jgi:hypothetical protein